MNPINWRDPPFDDGSRIIQTEEKLNIPGLRMFGKHSVTKAIPALYPHYHENAFEITYLCKGTLTFFTDDQTHHLSGGDIYISFPNEAHSTGAVPISLNEMYWFQLDISVDNFLFLGKEWKEKIIEDLYQVNSRLINTNTGEMQKLMKEFYRLTYNQNEDEKFHAASALIYFLSQLISYSKKQEKIITNDIQAAVDYILANIYENISLDYLAELSGLSLSRFKQKFCQQLGFTPREYINFQKVEASKLMLGKGKNVTDTAIELGFSTSNYFSSVFKRFTTLSPSDYLRSTKI
ncbi:MAG TPA: AraC family transcriptional regulator [Anaerovoracaceae bacterium]|nr:AraC family transcriptional regulator [Anaerovoracaceae bacterium]